MRILIVDDEADIRKTTRSAVEIAGHVVVEAPNALGAVKSVGEESFDACLLDVKLGADNGLEVLAKLLKIQPTLAVVMFTASADVATAVEAMRCGASDFIVKPFPPEQICGVLARIEKTRALEARVRVLENELARESPSIDLESTEPATPHAREMAFQEAADPPASKGDPIVAVGGRVTVDVLEAEHIRRILATSRNLDEAAQTLGIDPATLYRKRQKLGLP